jgi:murein DD-endopeptidase MepM/ murein hydrolase activator NlpD
MDKTYKYNPEFMDFIEGGRNPWYYLYKGILYCFVGILFFCCFYVGFVFIWDTPQERDLIEKKEMLTYYYKILSKQQKQLDAVISDLQSRDTAIYHYVFETNPPSVGDDDMLLIIKELEEQDNETLVNGSDKTIDLLQKTINRQNALLRHLIEEYKRKKVDNVPTIQPVENRDFRYIAATYGIRMHPWYKVLKMHNGIDFSVPLGTHVCATAAGTIEVIERRYRNTGLSIVINHDNGYKTHYYHLDEAKVRLRQKVKRGDIIATVGNSGRAFAPHLHYEIWKDGKPCNPVHYFFGSISPEDYYKLKVIAANKGQSLD